MTPQTEALKLLVEALSLYETRTDGLVNKALAAGKEALAQPEQEQSGFFSREAMKAHSDGHMAQPEQEPVAWTVAGQVRDWSKDFSAYKTQHYVRPVYTTPPQRTWVGLTEEEILGCMEMSIQKTCRAIEAKLKEKNI